MDSVDFSWREYFFYFNLPCKAQANFSSWAHEICSEDNEERSLVIGSMNEMAYVFQAWLPLLVWQQVDGPEYQKGFITVSCLSIALIVSCFVVRHLDLKEKDAKR